MNHEILIQKLKKISPGTDIRVAIDNIISADIGALIVFADDEERCKNIIQPGFEINCPFDPNKLFELAKMDGAIIISEDISKILFANVQLTPDPTIPTSQTGMRHRAAERFAKQKSMLVIAISKRRKEMSIFYDDIHYTLLSVEAVLSRLTQTMFTLEKYKSAFLDGIEEIDVLDKTDSLTLYDVVETIQKGFVILTVSKELEISLAQIGKEGAHSIMQLNEINFGVRDELKELMLDYSKTLPEIDSIDEILDNSDRFIEKGSVNKPTFSKILGYEVHNASDLFDTIVNAKGIRFIKRIPRIPLSVAYKVGMKFGSFQNLVKANYNEIKEVEGIGDVRASLISNKISSYLRDSR